MQKLTLFYLENCPYCRKALRALEALAAEKPEYAAAEIERVEESRSPEVAARYDYYYVPTVFLGGRKLWECSPADDYGAIYGSLRAALDEALKG